MCCKHEKEQCVDEMSHLKQEVEAMSRIIGRMNEDNFHLEEENGILRRVIEAQKTLLEVEKGYLPVLTCERCGYPPYGRQDRERWHYGN